MGKSVPPSQNSLVFLKLLECYLVFLMPNVCQNPYHADNQPHYIFTTKHISLLCYTKVSEFIILQILSGENDKKSQKNLGCHILLVTL